MMFKCINAARTETRTFDHYAEAYRFVMREGDQSRLWGIYAARPELVEACRAERNDFRKAS
jgi:hypothetical protein